MEHEPGEELEKGLADSLREVSRKDLTKPGNLNGYIDIVLWVAVILISIFCSETVNPTLMVSLAFGATFLCIVWCIIHYTIMQHKHRR
jgi:hypothetical protein